MMIPILGPVFFAEPNASDSPIGWPWIAGFLSAVFLALSAYTRRRGVSGQ